MASSEQRMKVGASVHSLFPRTALSLAEEIRRPLLQKGANAFAIFVPRPGLALEIALEVELRVEAISLRR